MNRFLRNRMAIAALAVMALFVCVERAQATDISGTITSTLTIFDNSQLVSDVSCNVPLTAADAKGVASCIAFGASHITLRLNGHTLMGPVDPPTNCSLPTDATFGVGVYVNDQTDVKIEGPGVIQHFQRWGIALRPGPVTGSTVRNVTVRKVTVNRNCWSGIQVTGTSDNTFEEDILTNNAAGSNGAACGGICLNNSNKNRFRKCIFHGNGSVDYPTGNVDFGIGFEGNSSENRVEENDIGGNTNGVLFFNTSSDNVVRRNLIVGNPSAQVSKTFVASNQGGADIAFRASFTGANNVLEENFCLTYLQGGGPATAPCPNFRTGGVEEDASRFTSPPHSLKGSNGPRTPSRFQMASAIASFLVVALGLGLLYGLRPLHRMINAAVSIGCKLNTSPM